MLNSFGDGDALAILFGGDGCKLVVIADLRGCLPEPLPAVAELIEGSDRNEWHRVLSSN